MSTCLPLTLRILPSAPLAFKKNNYGGTPPMPPRMGCRPYEPATFHPRVAATGWNDCIASSMARNGASLFRFSYQSGQATESDLKQTAQGLQVKR
jgi:hypothetical protein